MKTTSVVAVTAMTAERTDFTVKCKPNLTRAIARTKPLRLRQHESDPQTP